MDIITRAHLKTLIEHRSQASVSIYMPTHKVTRDGQQDRITCEGLLRKTRQMLLDSGRSELPPEEILEPAFDLLNNRAFWFYQSHGLALFLTEEFFRYFRLPLAFETLLTVAPRFHIKPLMPMFCADGKYYVLALSLNEARLFECTRQTVEELEPDEMPTSLQEALQYDDPQRQLQFHTGTQSFGQRRAAMFHGHGVGKDDTKTNILRFCQQVSTGVQEILREETAPLLLAGVDHVLAIYRKANKYAGLLSDIVPGNPEELTAEELHRQTWPIVEGYLRESRLRAAELYLSQSNTPRATNDLREIVTASFHGRVDLLFVPLGVQRWGSYDATSETVELGESENAGVEDLLNLATVQTLVTGGRVFVVEPEAMPGGEPQAALFRY